MDRAIDVSKCLMHPFRMSHCDSPGSEGSGVQRRVATLQNAGRLPDRRKEKLVWKFLAPTEPAAGAEYAKPEAMCLTGGDGAEPQAPDGAAVKPAGKQRIIFKLPSRNAGGKLGGE